MKREEILELRGVVQQFIRSFGLLEQSVTPCGFALSLSQSFALQELEINSLTLSELADKLSLDRSSVSRLIDSLVKGGFVNREINQQNRREVILTLTEKGSNAVKKLREQSVSYYQSILANLPEEEQQQVLLGFKSFTKAIINKRGE